MDAAASSRLLVRPLKADDALRVARWRYRGQWSAYDLESPAGLVAELDLYRAVTDAVDILVGFVCVGAAARVPGLDADAAFLDVGVGMDPDLAGRGRGPAFGDAVLDHLARRYPERPLRAVIQAWNERSLRFTARHGFVDVGVLVSSRDRRDVRYRILVKPAATSSRRLVTRSGIWLFGDRLMLREFVAADEEAVHSYAADPGVTQFTDWGPNDVADTQAFLAGVLAQGSDPERTEFTFAAVHLASGGVIGSGEIRVTDVLHRRGEFGYVVHRDLWSRGYATEVALLLVRFGFEHLRLRHISATCHPDNHASARVLQKAGLRYQGRIHDHRFVRGAWRDSMIYTTVRSEP